MNALIVHLCGKRAGVLVDNAGRLAFGYDKTWLEDEESIPLSRQLPLQSGVFEGKVVSVFFGGLLPEANARDQIARNLGISADNDFAMLARIGGECAGAVALLPEEHSDDTLANAGARWLDEGEVVEVMSRLPRRPLLAGENGLRLSLAGAQVKLPVVLETSSTGDLRLALPLGNQPSTHIIKPEPAGFPGLAENEAWCMALGRQIGLEAAEVRAEKIGGVPCLIARRYDRRPSTSADEVNRLHQEDFCQALGYPSSRKYQQEGGPSLKECFQLVREWSTTPVLDLRHMLDAVIFAAVTGNADAHGKNHSFLYARGSRRMAPIYDQVCTLAWPELSTTLSMKIGAASRLEEVSPEHFQQMCEQAKLGWPMVRDRIGELCRRMLAAIHESGELPELKAPILLDIVTRRAERMSRLVQRSKG